MSARGGVVVLSANIRTMDPARPRVTALAVRAGRIAYAGDDAAAARAAAPKGARILDLPGRTITPGFTDAHTHLASWARALDRLSIAGARTLEDALDLVRAAHVRLQPGARLEGEDVPPFDQAASAWGRAPGREDLDRAAPGRAVVLRGRDRHAAWLSSAALAESGITRATPDPPGGRIGRDAAGEPDGLLFENAVRLIAGDAPGATDLGGVLARLGALGITGVHEFGDVAAWHALAALRDAGALPVRVAFGFMVRDPAALDELPDPATQARGERLWPFALKGFVDGTLGSRTAWMLEPFADGSGTGMPIHDDAALDALGAAARARGLTLALHAIGDRATRAALDAFARWPAAARARLRPRIEHAQLVHPDDVPRFAALDVIASMQPVHALSDRALAERVWGARDAAGGYAWRAIEHAGGVLAFGSDVPIEGPDPRAGLWAAVTGADAAAARRGAKPARALPLDRAFAAFTTGAAFAARCEDRLGRLAPGCHADFAVWDADPWEAPVDGLRALPLVSTWVGGEPVWPPV